MPRPTIHPTDRHVGARLRLRRLQVGMSQTELGDTLGVSFQQLQKYESGANRISASKLYAAAGQLRAPVAWFFEDLVSTTQETDGDTPRLESDLQSFLSSREGLEMAQRFPRLSARQRRQLLALVHALADAAAEADNAAA